MKYKILILFLIAVNFNSFAQFSEPYRLSKIILKTGDTLIGMGKTKNKGFKYKAHSNVKPYYIELSKIDFVQQKYSGNESKIFRFFQTINNDTFIKVEELVKGEQAELYAVIYNVNSGGAGGMSISQTVVKYYVKKKSEKKITLLGPYSPLTNNLKEKTINYFSDCPELIGKIESKDFRIRNGLEQIVEFYNENCKLE
jgi:hypothetical protein